MRFAHRSASVRVLMGTALSLLAFIGCGPGVRQDRTIAWSPEGKHVGFQHDEGVFVAGEDGQELRKIFQPAPDVIATSPPLWSPQGGRLIFTTARDPNQPAGQNPAPPFAPNPEGDRYHQRPVVYTCWLWEKPSDGQTSQPTPLFEANCGHPGYVAANLAVRWHPKGEHILYIKDIGNGRHGLFEYNLRAQTSRSVFPHTAEALIFDWAPGGGKLACVLADSKLNNGHAGIWIGAPGEQSWWHVSGSESFSTDPSIALLDQARARQPAWTADGARFAFATFQPGKANEKSTSALMVGNAASRQVDSWIEAKEPFHDLHWAKDGTRLGVILGRPVGSLHILQDKAALAEPINRLPVRRFAGWNAAGDQLAYVVPSRIEPPDKNCWAFLLTPDRMPRDAVYVAPGAGNEPGRKVFAGMRVTFPQWAPKEDKLSVWFTFSPTHRSLPARLLEAGVTPGDPAAVLDPKTGAIGWMAVNAVEKAQIGHYHLLRREYATAWKWYEQAEAAQPSAPQPATPERRPPFLLTRQDFSFFAYHCLTQLGKEAEAQTRLKRFQRTFAALFAPSGQGRPPMKEYDRFLAALLRDLYAAEVFLSLDAVKEGQRFFHAALATAPTDAERLSGAIVLGQMLLLEKKHAEYADLVADTVLPLLAKVGRPGAPEQNRLNGLTPLMVLGELALFPIDLTVLPLCAPEFLATLTDEQVRALIPRWTKPPAPGADDESRLLTDLFLEAAYARLGQKKNQEEAGARAQANPARARFLPQGVTERVKEARELPEQLEALREWFSGR